MSKSQEKIITGLKLRAHPKDGVLSLRVGVRKYVLPFQVKMLESGEYLFVHLPSSAEIFRLDDKQLVSVDSLDEAAKASTSFKKYRKPVAVKGKAQVDIPGELLSALSKVPEGYKLGYDTDGKPKLVRSRKRGSSGG